MEQAKVINPNLSIFVCNKQRKTDSTTWKLGGVPLDGYYGFGRNSNCKFFEGLVTLVNLDQKITQNMLISSGHFPRDDFNWFLREIDELPQTPFLITDDVNTEIIFKGYISLSSEQDIIDSSEPDDYIYAVSSARWFGFISFSENNLFLIAFSSCNNATVKNGDELWTFEWDCSMGNLTIVASKSIEA